LVLAASYRVAVGERVRFGICTDQNLPWLKLVERWKLFEGLGFDSDAVAR
jgi:hypothetical protein